LHNYSNEEDQNILCIYNLRIISVILWQNGQTTLFETPIIIKQGKITLLVFCIFEK